MRKLLILARHKALAHTCPTQAREPNLARHVIIFGPRGNIKRTLELARGVYCAATATDPTMSSKHKIPYEALIKLLVKSSKQKIYMLVGERKNRRG